MFSLFKSILHQEKNVPPPFMERKIKIVVVDDESSVRQVVRRMMEKLLDGCEVYEAEDGFKAERVIDETRPDILFMDLVLPFRSGVQLYDEIKNRPWMKNVLVFGMTGYNSPENVRMMMNEGALDCLLKPFGLDELKNLVQKYINHDADKECNPQSFGDCKHANDFLRKMGLMMGIIFSPISLQPLSGEETVRLVQKYDQTNENKEKNFLEAKKIAVAPFKSFNRMVDGKSFSDSFVEMLTKKIPKVSVIERPDIGEILSEQNFSISGAVKGKNDERLGQIEPVDAILIGTIRTLERFDEDGGAIVVTVKMVELTTGKVLWSHRQESRCYFIGIDPYEMAEVLIGYAVEKIVKKMKSDKSVKQFFLNPASQTIS